MTQRIFFVQRVDYGESYIAVLIRQCITIDQVKRTEVGFLSQKVVGCRSVIDQLGCVTPGGAHKVAVTSPVKLRVAAPFRVWRAESRGVETADAIYQTTLHIHVVLVSPGAEEFCCPLAAQGIKVVAEGKVDARGVLEGLVDIGRFEQLYVEA